MAGAGLYYAYLVNVCLLSLSFSSYDVIGSDWVNRPR